MKLTKSKLIQIIREEVENTVKEAERGDFGSHKKQRKYASTEYAGILVAPAGGGSYITLDDISNEMESQDLGIAKTRRGWKAIAFNGTEEEMREKLASDATFSSIVSRISDARQRITQRMGSTTSRVVYPFRDRGESGGKVYIKLGDDEPILVEL